MPAAASHEELPGPPWPLAHFRKVDPRHGLDRTGDPNGLESQLLHKTEDEQGHGKQLGCPRALMTALQVITLDWSLSSLKRARSSKGTQPALSCKALLASGIPNA